MKFTTQLNEFQKLLQKVIPAISVKPPFEMLELIYLKIEGNELTAIASDVEITILSKINVEGIEDGAALVHAKKLNDFIKELDPSKEVHFECNTENYKVKIGSGKTKCELNGIDADEYIELPDLFKRDVPTLEDPNELIVPFKKEIIQTLTDKTYFAVSRDDYRQNMSGVLMEFRENFVNAVATDSYRLIRATSFAGNGDYPKELDILIPAKAIEVLRKVDSDVIFSFDSETEKPKQLRVDFGDTILVSRLIKETFPKYAAIIPVSSNCQATFDVSEILTALKRVTPFANQNTKKCRLEFSANTLNVLTEDESSGETASEEMPCELLEMDNFVITFNIKYLEEMLNNITLSDTTNNLASMFFITPEKAALIKPKSDIESLVQILMPIRMS